MSAWYIKTRKEFFEVLDRAIAEAGGHNAEAPDFRPLASVLAQLEAMKKWTAGGRKPLPEEVKRINIGLIAVREIDASISDEMMDFHETLLQLDGYFRIWPDDPPGDP